MRSEFLSEILKAVQHPCSSSHLTSSVSPQELSMTEEAQQRDLKLL